MNNKKLGYGILAALFVLFNVIAFAIPVNCSSAFWVAYVFTVVSFAAQIIIWNNAFPKDGKDVFLGIPIVRIGVYYLVIQCIAFLIFMFIPSAPVWIPIIVCAAVCCVVCVILLSTNVARNEVARVGSKVKEYTFNQKEIYATVCSMVEQETSEETKKELSQLVEELRFSDPICNVSLCGIEDEIKEKIGSLCSSDDKVADIKKIRLLLKERNQKCKLFK